ncbi:MAG: formylglycine-generating enzyme family protein, partial [Planctomycetota bacterium]
AGEEYLHRINLTRSFYMSKYEITNAVWQAVTGKTLKLDGKAPEPDHPVVNVSWNDINKQFFTKLQKKAIGKMIFRLPTEAEWEYACRSGSRSVFYTGDTDKDLLDAGVCVIKGSKGPGKTGQLKANSWGIYDMHGNVSEWCLDNYDSKFYIQPGASGDNPVNTKASPFRVVRGGAWSLLPKHCRSAYRSYGHPENRYKSLGFRVVLAAPVQKKKTNLAEK